MIGIISWRKVVFWAFALLLIGATWDRSYAVDDPSLLHQLNVVLQQANGQAPVRRMLALNQKALANIARVDIAAGLRTKEINALVPDLIERTNAGNELKKANVKLLTGSLTPENQQLEVTISVLKVYPNAEIELLAKGDAAVGASGDTLFFDIHLNQLKVTKIRVTTERFDLSAAAPLITAGIKPLLGLLNVEIDREVNKKRPLGVRLKIPPLYANNLANSDTNNLQFVPRQVDIVASISQSAALLTAHGLIVLGTLENKKPNGSTASVTQFDGPSAATNDEVSAALEDYQKKFGKKFNEAFGKDSPKISKKSFLLLSRAFAASTLNSALGPPAICAAGRLSGRQPPFTTPISVPLPNQNLCDDVIRSCTYKDMCASQDACTSTVREMVDSTCKTGEKFVDAFDPVGAAIRKSVPIMSPCKVWRTVRKEVESDACKAFRGARTANPLMCKAGSNIAKSQCDAIVAGNRAVCRAEQKLRDFAQANPVAVLRGTVTPDIKFDNTCVSTPTIDKQFNNFTAGITAKAAGSLDVHLSFENETPPGAGLCTADWAENFSFKTATNIPLTQMSFAVTPERAGDTLDLVFRAKDQDVLVNFQPAPLDELFRRHPKMIVNCAPLAGLGLAYAAYDTVVNEKAKHWSPLLSGKDYKLTIKEPKFRFNIPRLDVRDLHEKVLFSLAPNWRSEALSFEK